MTALIPRTGYTLSPRRVTVNPAHVRDALQALLNTGHPLPDVHRASCEALGRAVGLDFAGLYAAAHEGVRL